MQEAEKRIREAEARNAGSAVRLMGKVTVAEREALQRGAAPLVFLSSHPPPPTPNPGSDIEAPTRPTPPPPLPPAICHHRAPPLPPCVRSLVHLCVWAFFPLLSSPRPPHFLQTCPSPAVTQRTCAFWMLYC